MNIGKNLLILFVVSMACVDLLLLRIYGVEATFSHIMLDWSRKYPIIPFSFGVLMGHLFWPQKK